MNRTSHGVIVLPWNQPGSFGNVAAFDTAPGWRSPGPAMQQLSGRPPQEVLASICVGQRVPIIVETCS